MRDRREGGGPPLESAMGKQKALGRAKNTFRNLPGLLCLALAPGRTQVLASVPVSYHTAVVPAFLAPGPVSWKMNPGVGGWFWDDSLALHSSSPLLCSPQTGDPAIQCLRQALSQWDDPDATAQCRYRRSPQDLLHTGRLLEILPAAGTGITVQWQTQNT